MELPQDKDGDLELTLTFSPEEQGEQDATNVFTKTNKQTNSLVNKILIMVLKMLITESEDLPSRNSCSEMKSSTYK